MRLSVLRALVDTVTAGRTSPLAEAAAARWGRDPGSPRYVRVSANAVFTFRRDGRPLVLRLTPPGSRAPAALEAECAFVGHLAARGVPVARPVPASTGALVETVPGELGPWHAVVFDRLPGVHPEVGGLSPVGFARWGRALGELHRAAQGWPALAGPSRSPPYRPPRPPHTRRGPGSRPGSPNFRWTATRSA